MTAKVINKSRKKINLCFIDNFLNQKLISDWYFFRSATINWVSVRLPESCQNGIITRWGQEVV